MEDCVVYNIVSLYFYTGILLHLEEYLHSWYSMQKQPSCKNNKAKYTQVTDCGVWS